ncbi:MAG: tetratricopeptide repeat protein [Cytophagales bacterium]|nr:tetratricopeptide repeat protein [Cytophagales bacterium]
MVVKYLNKYENQLNVEKNIKEASRHLNETAFLYWEHNQYHMAIKYYEMSLELNRQIGNENGLAMLHNNLGMLNSDVENYKKSHEYFNKTLAARRAMKESAGIISALINMTIVLNHLNRFDESAAGLEEALVLAREMNDPQQMKSCYGTIGNL